MLYIQFKEDYSCLHIEQSFLADPSSVIEIQADCDELGFIIDIFPFLYEGGRVQTFKDNVAKMIMVIWQKEFNKPKEY